METILLVWTDPAVRRALLKERPGRLVLATDEASPEDRVGYDAVVDLPPVYDVPATLDALRKIPFDRIFFQTEFGLPAGCLLAMERGIPGPSPYSVLSCLDKAMTRRRLASMYISQPRFAVVRSAAEVRASGIRNYPIILKARASTLGRLVTKVDRDADLDAAVARLLASLPSSPDIRRLVSFARLAGLELEGDPTRDFLVESFAEGLPLEADGLAMGGVVDCFGITEQVVRDGDGFYIEAYEFPVGAPDLLDQARRAIEVLSLNETGFSIEFRGHLIIEVNGRLGEDDGFPDLFRAGIGAFPVVRQIFEDARPSAVRGAHALAYVNRYKGGVVRRVVEPAGTTVVVKEGQRLFEPGTPAYRAHVAYAIASHPTSSRAALAAARERLRGVVVDVEGEESVTPRAPAASETRCPPR